MILAKQKSEEAKEREDATEQDLFSDMAPTIKRQKKVFVGERRGNGAEQGSRLRAVEQDPLVRMMITVMDMMVIVVHQMSAGAELGTWEDGGSSNAAGWQPEDDDLGEVLRWVSMIAYHHPLDHQHILIYPYFSTSGSRRDPGDDRRLSFSIDSILSLNLEEKLFQNTDGILKAVII